MSQVKRLCLIAAFSALGTVLVVNCFRRYRFGIHNYHSRAELPNVPPAPGYRQLFPNAEDLYRPNQFHDSDYHRNAFYHPQSSSETAQRNAFYHPQANFERAHSFSSFKSILPNHETWENARSPHVRPRPVPPQHVDAQIVPSLRWEDIDRSSQERSRQVLPQRENMFKKDHRILFPSMSKSDGATLLSHYSQSEADKMEQSAKELGKRCSSDGFSCGAGFYCCDGSCRAAKMARIEFAADDKGELWICKRKARKTDTNTQTATYDGMVPCSTDIYIKAVNSYDEGGTAVGVRVSEGPKYGSGSTLAMTSQANYQGSFAAVANFTSWHGTWPYTALTASYGAYPVKDAYNSRAQITNFKFQVC